MYVSVVEQRAIGVQNVQKVGGITNPNDQRQDFETFKYKARMGKGSRRERYGRYVNPQI